MNRYVLDIEGDGLREECTVIHCATLRGIDEKISITFADIPEDMHPVIVGTHQKICPMIELPGYLHKVEVLIGHNILGYDLPVLKKLLNYEYKKRKVDTLIWSKTLNPDRKLPKNCPTSLLNPYTGKKERVGPHSLHAWGYRVGLGKPEHYDWEHISVGMILRNIADTKINELVYKALCQEAGVDV